MRMPCGKPLLLVYILLGGSNRADVSCSARALVKAGIGNFNKALF